MQLPKLAERYLDEGEAAKAAEAAHALAQAEAIVTEVAKRQASRIHGTRGAVTLYQGSAWPRTPFHFFHHDFVVGQHQNAKSGELVTKHSGDKIGKRGV